MVVKLMPILCTMVMRMLFMIYIEYAAVFGNAHVAETERSGWRTHLYCAPVDGT